MSVFGLKALLFVAALLATALIWFALVKAPAMGKETGDAMFAARATAAPITAAPPVIQNTSAAASLATVPAPSPVVPPAAPEPVKARQAPTGGTTATPSAMAAPEPKVVDVSRLYRVKADKVMATFKRTVDVEIFKHESEATLAAPAQGREPGCCRPYFHQLRCAWRTQTAADVQLGDCAIRSGTERADPRRRVAVTRAWAHWSVLA